jgi:hypothetical protein
VTLEIGQVNAREFRRLNLFESGGHRLTLDYLVAGRFAFDRWHIADQFHDAGLLYQSTHSSAAISRASMRRRGSSRQINSGLYKH